MTRKDFELIARGFKAEMERLQAETATGLDREYHMVGLELAARSVADELVETNPRFDKYRFLTACGVRAMQQPVRLGA